MRRAGHRQDPRVDLRGNRGARPGSRCEGTVAAVARTRGAPLRFIPDLRTNALIVLASPDTMKDVEELVQKLDVPGPPPRAGRSTSTTLKTPTPRTSRRSSVPWRTRRRKPPGRTTPRPGRRPAAYREVRHLRRARGGVRITPDKATNSLVIVASLNDYETLVQVIRRLDIRRRQVYVEAVFMEVNIDNSKDLGVEWRGAIEVGNSGGGPRGNQFRLPGASPTSSPRSRRESPRPRRTGAHRRRDRRVGHPARRHGDPGRHRDPPRGPDHGNINILSAPHLITVDNKEAEIIVAENVPSSPASPGTRRIWPT